MNSKSTMQINTNKSTLTKNKIKTHSFNFDQKLKMDEIQTKKNLVLKRISDLERQRENSQNKHKFNFFSPKSNNNMKNISSEFSFKNYQDRKMTELKCRSREKSRNVDLPHHLDTEISIETEQEPNNKYNSISISSKKNNENGCLSSGGSQFNPNSILKKEYMKNENEPNENESEKCKKSNYHDMNSLSKNEFTINTKANSIQSEVLFQEKYKELVEVNHSFDHQINMLKLESSNHEKSINLLISFIDIVHKKYFEEIENLKSKMASYDTKFEELREENKYLASQNRKIKTNFLHLIQKIMEREEEENKREIELNKDYIRSLKENEYYHLMNSKKEKIDEFIKNKETLEKENQLQESIDDEEFQEKNEIPEENEATEINQKSTIQVNNDNIQSQETIQYEDEKELLNSDDLEGKELILNSPAEFLLNLKKNNSKYQEDFNLDKLNNVKRVETNVESGMINESEEIKKIFNMKVGNKIAETKKNQSRTKNR